VQRSTFFGIEIGKTGITMSQLGLDVTGHNIANADTKGYTRQRLITTAYDPYSTIGRLLPVESAKVGGGAKIKILDQIRDRYLDIRFRAENTTNSYWTKRSQGLTYVEAYFDNVKDSTRCSGLSMCSPWTRWRARRARCSGKRARTSRHI